MDVLNAKKPLIVVVNEELMHNHQLELAEQLSSDGYLLYTTLNMLSDTVKSFCDSNLKEYETGSIEKLVLHLDTFMRFSETHKAAFSCYRNQ